MIHCTLSYLFQYPWTSISEGFWRKYPHPSRPDILSIDVIERNLDPNLMILSVTRLIAAEMIYPSWITSIWLRPPVVCYVLESVKVNLREQKMTIHTQNITFPDLISVNEDCSYQSKGEDTYLIQDIKIKVGVIGIGYYIEQWIFENFKIKSQNGQMIMEELLGNSKTK